MTFTVADVFDRHAKLTIGRQKLHMTVNDCRAVHFEQDHFVRRQVPATRQEIKAMDTQKKTFEFVMPVTQISRVRINYVCRTKKFQYLVKI